MSKIPNSLPAKSNAQVRTELENIRKADPKRELRPEAVVDFAKRNKSSALGKLYPRNDVAAAHQFRLEWARAVIRLNVTIITPDPRKTTITVVSKAYQSLSDRRGAQGGYIPTESALSRPALRHRLLLDTLQRLEQVQEVNLFPEEFADIIKAIADARTKFPEPAEEEPAKKVA